MSLANDGQQSATDPFTIIDTATGRVKGGASFAGSFGPGRYYAYVCVDVKGDGFESNVTEYGVWQGNSAVKGSVKLSQLYLGAHMVLRIVRQGDLKVVKKVRLTKQVRW